MDHLGEIGLRQARPSGIFLTWRHQQRVDVCPARLIKLQLIEPRFVTEGARYDTAEVPHVFHRKSALSKEATKQQRLLCMRLYNPTISSVAYLYWHTWSGIACPARLNEVDAARPKLVSHASLAHGR